MMRVLKSLCTANLLLAIAVVIVYIIYGAISGLAVDEYFLGWRPWKLGRGGPRDMPAWTFAVFFNVGILIAYIALGYAEGNLNKLRIPCAVVGLLHVLALFALRWPSYVNHTVDAEQRLALIAAHPVDHILMWYVWGSHLVFALIGPNDD